MLTRFSQKHSGLMAVVLVLTVGIGLAVAQNSPGGAFLTGYNYVIGGQWTWRGASPFIFEGATDNPYETTLTVTDPTADRTWTIQNATDTFVGRATTDTLTNKTLTSPTLTTPTLTSPTINLPIIASESVTAAGATETLTSADCGQTILLDTGTGSVVTLPAATGSGCTFRFLATVDGEHSLVVVGNDEFVGGLVSIGTTADNADAFSAADAGDVDTITMNQTTTGGLGGTWIVIQDISADNWGLSGTVISTDASATMLLTAQVS